VHLLDGSRRQQRRRCDRGGDRQSSFGTIAEVHGIRLTSCSPGGRLCYTAYRPRDCEPRIECVPRIGRLSINFSEEYPSDTPPKKRGLRCRLAVPGSEPLPSSHGEIMARPSTPTLVEPSFFSSARHLGSIANGACTSSAWSDCPALGRQLRGGQSQWINGRAIMAPARLCKPASLRAHAPSRRDREPSYLEIENVVADLMSMPDYRAIACMPVRLDFRRSLPHDRSRAEMARSRRDVVLRSGAGGTLPLKYRQRLPLLGRIYRATSRSLGASWG